MKKEELIELLEYVFEEAQGMYYGRCGDSEYYYETLEDLIKDDNQIDKFMEKHIKE